MDNISRTFLDLDDDTKLALDSNRINILNELRAQNIQVTRVEHGVINQNLDSNIVTRDIVPIILASSAAITAISYALSMLFESINNKPKVITIEGLEEIRDASGEVLLGRDGNPVYKPVTKIEIVRPSKNIPKELMIDVFKIFKITVKSK